MRRAEGGIERSAALIHRLESAGSITSDSSPRKPFFTALRPTLLHRLGQALSAEKPAQSMLVLLDMDLFCAMRGYICLVLVPEGLRKRGHRKS